MERLPIFARTTSRAVTTSLSSPLYAMRRFGVLFLALWSLCATSVSAQTITLSGAYQGKNLYVQNPFTGNLKDFCTEDVYVNDVKVLSSPRSSAYEIDLSHLSNGADVTVRITHKGDCQPKILNPQVIQAASKFAFKSVDISQGAIAWSTAGETPGGYFYIQQFRNNNWTTQKRIRGRGSNPASYSTEPTHHSLINKYRIKYNQNDGQIFYSKTIEFQSSTPLVEFYPKRVSTSLNFSADTDFEIYDRFGNKVKEGRGTKVDCTDLKGNEVYTVVFDNQTRNFLKKPN